MVPKSNYTPLLHSLNIIITNLGSSSEWQRDRAYELLEKNKSSLVNALEVSRNNGFRYGDMYLASAIHYWTPEDDPAEIRQNLIKAHHVLELANTKLTISQV